MGLCLWKSLLCLRRANMRGWVIALFCCGTLGSDERRVPVVKMAKDQVFHRWREGKTLTEKWLRSPATLMLATAQEVIWFSEGQSTQQHPLGDSDIWKTTFLLALEPYVETPSFANISFAGFVWLTVLGQRNDRNTETAVLASSDCSESKPWSLPWTCLLYQANLLGRIHTFCHARWPLSVFLW